MKCLENNHKAIAIKHYNGEEIIHFKYDFCGCDTLCGMEMQGDNVFYKEFNPDDKSILRPLYSVNCKYCLEFAKIGAEFYLSYIKDMKKENNKRQFEGV